MKLPKPVTELSNILIALAARPVIVGGYVRDFFMHHQSKDIDIEVYNIGSLDDLRGVLKELAPVYEVGKNFGVLKMRYGGYDFDISLPRTEIKIAKGHKGFDVHTNGYLSFKAAAVRRDFSMNAIGYDIKEEHFLDPFGGQKDISNRLIRHIDDKGFVEDPLRVFRAVQFAARFNYTLHPNTLKLCQNMVKREMLCELPKERVFEEIKKLLLKAELPSVGFELLDQMGALFYELKALQGVPQDKVYHPEGDVWTHTMMSLDAMSSLKTGDEKRDLILLLAVLCHDLGKAQTTQILEGKIRSIGHENYLTPMFSFLKRLSDEKDLLAAIIPLVKEHLAPSQLFKQEAKDSAVRRLSTRVKIDDLIFLAKADNFGRTTEDAKKRIYPAGEWLLSRARELHVEEEKPKPLLQGRHLISREMVPGERFKKILDAAYEAQLEGEFFTHSQAETWLDTYLSSLS
jgi:tRNA nucleotidyltransferase (CCA-adding enzyme)